MISRPIAPPTEPPQAAPAEIQAVARLVNAHRDKIGCKPLTWLSPVAAVAQRHSQDMYANRFFSHNNLLGESPFDRLRLAGIKYQRAAENIAMGQNTAQRVVTSWMNSPGHRRNIEDCAMQQHGIGLYQNHWTHMFVTLAK